MKIKEIEIINYRSIEYVKLSIDDFLVLIGENNSGKSSILKGVELFYSESLRSFNNENFHFKDIMLVPKNRTVVSNNDLV
ncbi:MAG: AAA family ATPase [Bacteroidota bacterium]|jgi:predicted ATP-dependent endonuclease of OLD family